jgi:hypothetical protein
MFTRRRKQPPPCSIVTVERQITAAIKCNVPLSRIPDAERSVRRTLNATLPSLDTGALGREVTLWRTPVNGQIAMEPGTIVARAFEPEDYVICSELPAGQAVHHLLVGPFDKLPAAWQTLFEWCAKEKRKLAGVNWQIYGELSPDPAQQQTFLYALLA